jgi:hypothetical protein
MSTFELEFARAKKEGLSNKDATDRGIKVATDMVYETLFNYSQYNKPRIMKAGAIPRLATQFMSFPLQMPPMLLTKPALSSNQRSQPQMARQHCAIPAPTPSPNAAARARTTSACATAGCSSC